MAIAFLVLPEVLDLGFNRSWGKRSQIVVPGWIRLLWGLLILLPLLVHLAEDFASSTQTRAFYARTLFYFVAILVIYPIQSIDPLVL